VQQHNLGEVANSIPLLCIQKLHSGNSERIITTERASVSAISLRHNLATSDDLHVVTPYVVAFTRFAGGGIWLPQESLRHILASWVIQSVSSKVRHFSTFLKYVEQEGWLSPTERASVSAISLRHILAS